MLPGSSGTRPVAVAAGFVIGLAVPARPQTAQLKPATAEAFARYVAATEARHAAWLKDGGRFLWIDRRPAAQAAKLGARVRGGEVVVERLQTRNEGGKGITAPDGLIHHWMGTVFISGSSTARVLAVLQDYDSHDKVYKPEVIRAKLRSRDNGHYKVYMRFCKKKIISVVLDTEHEVHCEVLDSKRAMSRSYSTRIAEIENPGEPTEKEKPVGNDHGFLWRLYGYWRVQERDGGVYLECEALSLTRSIPTGLGWLIGPFVTDIPSESLFSTLDSSRKEVGRRSSGFWGLISANLVPPGQSTPAGSRLKGFQAIMSTQP